MKGYKTKSNRILSFDPGLANTGWSVVNRNKDNRFAVVDCGLIVTSSDCLLGDRLQSLHNRILEIIQQHTPDTIAMEAVFFNKNVTSCLGTAQVIAIIELIAAKHRLDTLTLTPQQVKASCGNSKASKNQMRVVLSKLVNMKLENPHITDAIGCGIAGILKTSHITHF